MNEKLENIVEEAIDEAQDEVGYELTEEELAYSREMIKRLSHYYMKKENDKVQKRKVKAKRRAKNKVQRQSRRTNRK